MARLFNGFLLMVAVMVSMLVLLMSLLAGESLYYVPEIILLPPVAIVLAVLVRRGHLELGTWLFIIFAGCLITYIASRFGGISFPNIGSMMMVLVLIAVVFLDKHRAILVFIGAVGLEALLVVLQITGRLPLPRSPLPVWVILINHTTIMLGGLLVLNAASYTVSGALAKIRQQGKERQKLEDLYRRAISAADAVPYSLDYRTGQYTFMGEGIQMLTGYTASELTSNVFQSLIETMEMRTDMPSLNPEQAGKMVRGGQVGEWKCDYRIRTSSGEERWITDTSVQIYENTGDPVGAIGLLSDITERKRAEAALRDSERRWRAIFENSGAGIGMSDLDGKIIETNPAFQRMVGFSGDELCRMCFSELTHPEDLPAELEAVNAMLSQSVSAFESEKRYIRKDSTVFWARMVASLIPDDHGAPLFGVSIINDISQQKDAERALLELNSQLEQKVLLRTAELETANKELESFAYSVSHDLRAPLRAIDGYGSFLELDFGDQLTEDGQLLINNMRQATQKMSRLIDDMLKLSRVTRAEMTISSLDISQIVMSTLRIMSQQEPDRQVDFNVTPGMIAQGDAQLLQIAIENLLRNAWKFTSKIDQATIEVGKIAGSNPSTFYIRDNGAGFSMEYAEKLFIPFQRLHRADEFEGTGVGLATVQRIIHRHQGKIWAESTPGKGATFYFTLGE